MEKLSRYERIHGKRGVNKHVRVERMRARILRRKAKQ